MQTKTRVPLYFLSFTAILFTIVLVFVLVQQLILSEQQKKEQEAEHEFYEQVERYKKKEPILVPEKITSPEERFEQAWNLYQTENVAEALLIWDALFETNPEVFSPKASEMALIFYKFRHYQKTLHLLSQVNPSDILLEARCYRNLREYAKAEESYTRYLEQTPKAFEVRKELFGLYQSLQQENTEKGQQVRTHLLEVDRDPEMLKELVQESIQEATSKKNQKPLEYALKLLPENPQLHQTLGIIALSKKRLAESRSHFEKALSLSSSPSPQIKQFLLKTYQEEYWETGDEQLISDILQKFPNEPDAIELELLHLLSKKDYETLFKKIEKARELFPSTTKFARFEQNARTQYREDSLQTRFSYTDQIKIGLGTASFEVFDKKFASFDTLEHFKIQLHEFSTHLMQQKELFRFLSKNYEGVSLIPKDLSFSNGITLWDLSQNPKIHGQQDAQNDWNTFAQPFITKGEIQFSITSLPDENNRCLVRIDCQESQIAYRGQVQLSWVQEDTQWKIARLECLKMETLKQTTPWFQEIPFPLENATEKLHFEENQKLSYRYVYDLTLGGVSVADYNQDGWLDIYLPQRGSNLLLRNKGDGTFEDATEEAQVENNGDSRSATFIDYNQDGHLDLFVCNNFSKKFPIGNTLYRNKGDGTFEDVTEQSGLTLKNTCYNSSWADLDNDGDLDLFISCYGNLDQSPYQFIAYRSGGERNYLYLNQGNGTFLEVGETLGFTKKSWTYGTYLGDFNHDQKPDIYVINEYDYNELYINHGNLKFEEMGIDYNLRNFINSRSLTVQDFNTDQIPDLFLSNLHSYYPEWIASFSPHLQQRINKLTQASRGNTVLFGTIRDIFKEGTNSLDAMLSASSYGCASGDLTNDPQGYVYVGNGHYSAPTHADIEGYEWRRFLIYQESLERRVLTAEPQGYFANQYRRLLNYAQRENYLKHQDIQLLQLSFQGHTRNQLFQMQSENSLEMAFLAGIALKEDTRCVVFADLDRDGDLDLIVRTLSEIKLFRNETTNHNAVLIDVSAPTPIYGTRIRVQSEGKTRTRWIHSGEGFLSQFPTQTHFGLGTTSKIESLSIRWPDGKEQQWNNIENPGWLKIQYGQDTFENIPFATTPLGTK